MKRAVCTFICILFAFCLTACGKNNMKVKTPKVSSERYSPKEVSAAIDVIKDEFEREWQGCTLQEIYYAGDEISADYQDWANRNNADEVIVLLSTFDVDDTCTDGSLNKNFTYSDWMWILVKTNGGKWQHVDHGY